MKTNPNDPVYSAEKWAEAGNEGLTKREYFAAMAMQGLLANYIEHGMYGNSTNYPMVEFQAVMCADALIVELNKEK